MEHTAYTHRSKGYSGDTTTRWHQNSSKQNKRETKPDQDQWITIWLKKFDKIAESQKVQPRKRILQRTLIDLFLWRNPGSPYKIERLIIEEFIREFGEFGAETMRFFYTCLAASEQHLEYIDAVHTVGGVTDNATAAANIVATVIPQNPPQEDVKKKELSSKPVPSPEVHSDIS